MGKFCELVQEEREALQEAEKIGLPLQLDK